MADGRAILVTGGAGYIGAHVCWQLRHAGYLPVVLDDLSAGQAEFVKFGPFIRGDIADAALVADICERYKPAALMHFAALTDVAESMRQPEKYFANNSEKAALLLKAAGAAGVRKIIYSSTASVYGAPAGGKPIGEDTALAPINPYGESKLKTENFLRALPGAASVILRYFNAAGAAPAEIGIGEAHWPETHLIPRALLALQAGEPFQLYGSDYQTEDGTAVRDYVHVEDIAAAHILALQYLEKGGGNALCNLGSGKGYSVQQVIDAISAQRGIPVPLTHSPRRPGDPDSLVADAGRAKTLLGWAPQKTLADIISSAAVWHESQVYQDFFASKL